MLGFFEPRGIRVALGVDDFVEPLQLSDGIAIKRGAVEHLLPADEQLAKLCTPVADVVVADDAVAEQAQHTLERVADAGRADVSDVHGLGDVRRTEVDDDGARLRRRSEEEVLTTRGCGNDRAHRRRLHPKIQKARPGDLDLFANIADVELGQRIRGELARVHLPLLGQSHEGVALVVPKFRIGTGAHAHRGEAGFR